MKDKDIMAIGLRLLRPYRIPPECPYLSEDQRELSALDLKGRSEWMAEWLALADMAEKAPLLRKLSARAKSGQSANPRATVAKRTSSPR